MAVTLNRIRFDGDLNAESSLHKKEEVEENEQQQQQQQQQQHQQTTEHSENIDNGSDQTKTSQDLESLERRHEDANVAQSNEEQDLTSEKENWSTTGDLARVIII